VKRRIARALELAIGLGLVLAWAVTLRPASLGGPATYVVIRGDSMLPGYHSGDLVILQAATAYGPGDAVGYRVPEGEVGAGHVVVHRIVGGDAAQGFTVEGDNNPTPDPWLPRPGDVAGKVWMWIPDLGRIVTFAHQPAVAGALAVSLLAMIVVARQPRPRDQPVGRRQRGAWRVSTP